jgi:hypothetical protein
LTATAGDTPVEGFVGCVFTWGAFLGHRSTLLLLGSFDDFIARWDREINAKPGTAVAGHASFISYLASLFLTAIRDVSSRGPDDFQPILANLLEWLW